ncbi:ABC transporter permease [Micromonospora trifolii]
MTVQLTSSAADTSGSSDLRDVLMRGTRPPRANAFTVTMTFGWRALLKIKHGPMQLFDVTVFPLMLTLMFTYLLGGAIAGSTTVYLQDLLPGILVMAILMITQYTGAALNSDRTKGVFDRFKTLAIWRPGSVIGAMLGDLVRYSIAGILVVLLGVALGFRPAGGVIGVALGLMVVLLFSFAISWMWTAAAFVMPTPHSTMAAGAIIIFPLTFLSNIFADPKTMPGWLQAFIDVNPVTYVVSATRNLMFDRPLGNDLLWVLVSSAVIVAIFGPLTMWLYKNKQ